MRLDPRNRDLFADQQGMAYTRLGRWKEAIPAYKSCLVRYPAQFNVNSWLHSFLGSDYSFLGDEEGAQAEAAAIERHLAASPNNATGLRGASGSV